MLKGMKLSTKMALGFGIMLAIAAALGLASYGGLSSVLGTVDLDKAGNGCLAAMNQCATFRRDFAIHGFAVRQGETKNAVDHWLEAHAELAKQLTDLGGAAGLSAANREVVKAVLPKVESYRSSINQQVEARKTKDSAFAAWGRVGTSVTQDIRGISERVIDPASKAAQEAGKAEDITRWAGIAAGLDRDVIQPFLLLRVTATYLVATDADEQYQGYQRQLEAARAGLASWVRVIQDNQELKAVADAVKGYLDQYEQAGAQYYQGIVMDRQAGTEMAVLAGSIVESIGTLRESLATEMDTITARTHSLTIGMTLGAVVIGVVLTLVITRSIVKPINRIISGLDEGADQVNDAAGQVASASQQLAEGASEQASSLEETSSALEQVAAMTRTNAANAKQASDLSGQAKTAAENGNETMAQLNVAMAAISESSNQISKIIKVIEEIAFQTNLLALNAAVEAARAGEHGKGFAVVADEVRNLAQRAAQASREITGLIEDSVGKVKDGNSVAAEVGEALGAIASNVAKVADLVHGISGASEEQAQGVDQVNTAVAQMDKVTQQNAAGAEESASAAEELSAQAATVKAMVEDLATVIGGARQKSGGSSVTRPPAKAVGRPAAPAKKPIVSRPHAAPAPAAHGAHEADTSTAGDLDLSEF